MKKYTTNLRAEPRTKIAVEGRGFALSLPLSMQSPYSEFSLGNVRFYFKNAYTAIKALDPIPASWLIDISEVIDESEEVAA